jgi:hypothetical protein
MKCLYKHARLVSLALLVVIGGVGTAAYSLPSRGHDTYYYATSGGGTAVGEDYRGCQNDHFTWGDVTPYVEDNVWSCEEGGIDCYKVGWTSDHMTCNWMIDTCDDCADCSGPC